MNLTREDYISQGFDIMWDTSISRAHKLEYWQALNLYLRDDNLAAIEEAHAMIERIYNSPPPAGHQYPKDEEDDKVVF